MYARNIQIRAALLAVIALAVIAAFWTATASAATSRGCTINPYTRAGRLCIEHRASQAAPQTAVKKKRHQVANKHRSPQCRTANVCLKYMRCR
jgi:hypothetical protein